MPLDVSGAYVRVGSFIADKGDGRHFEAERIEEELNDLAGTITALNSKVDANSTPPDLSIYYTKSQIDSKLGDKQDAFAFTPAPAAHTHTINQITDYTESTGNGGTSGLASFMGRTDPNAQVTAQDVSDALGYNPASSSHTHAISSVTGLSTELNNKQDALGFTPAPASHTHAMSDIAGLEALAATLPVVSGETSASASVFPVGHIVSALMNSTSDGNGGLTYQHIQPNASRTVRVASKTVQQYDGFTSVSSLTLYFYTTGTTGTILPGEWRCRGIVSEEYNLMQRVS